MNIYTYIILAVLTIIIPILHYFQWLLGWEDEIPSFLEDQIIPNSQHDHNPGEMGHSKPGWWFQICFYFHPYLGKISILTNIFQRG